jgi:pimeloyl-ACP methyl ester carboxylesterase
MSQERSVSPTDEELLGEMRQLAISIQNNPSQKLKIVTDWYEQKLRTSGPQKAELGLLLLTILNARDSPKIEAVAEKPVVISLHGIRTRGDWQKQLSSALSREGFVYEPLDYGFFRAIQLVLPFMRERKMKWFLDQYNAVTKGYYNPPSIIAHSFGTYLVARTLGKYAELKFDHVIFCGSIVEIAYPWTRIADSFQVTRVLNDYGGRDFWAKTAVFFRERRRSVRGEGFSGLCRWQGNQPTPPGVPPLRFLLPVKL